MTPLLEMKGITKRYGEVAACREAGLIVQHGEIHALLGENGAGKTTLVRVLFGLTHSDEGEIRWRGEPVQIPSPRDALRLGIGMVHQHDMLVPAFTVAENFELSQSDRRFLLRPGDIRREFERLAREHSVQLLLETRAEDLTVAQRQWLSLLRVLAERVSLVILDEITSNITPAERERLFGTLDRLRSDGVSSILITHKLDEVFALADTVSVMRGGRSVATLRVAETSRQNLAELMVGHPLGERRELTAVSPGPVLLQIGGLEVDDEATPLHEIDLELRAGEIVGVAGIDGNGQRELADCLMGLRRPTAGRIVVDGVDFAGADPIRYLAAGVARIPEDRQAHGLALDMTVWENIHAGHLRRRHLVRRELIDVHRSREMAADLVRRFDVRARDLLQDARELSGGNQQKVILARELADEPALLLAMNPTRGLDIGATEFVLDQLMRVRQRGGGVLFVSFDLDELIAISDRIVVMSGGRIVGTLQRSEFDRGAIGLMMGSHLGGALADLSAHLATVG